MFTKMRPLRPSHLVLLLDCYKRHLKNETTFGVYYTQAAKGLLDRGLCESREFWKEGKIFVGFYLTNSGLDYLKNDLSIRVQMEESLSKY